MKNRYTVLLPLVVLLVGSTGCSRMNNTDKGALGGAVAGAITGGIIAATSSVHTGPGMGIGALIGGVVGAVVGGHMADSPDDNSGLHSQIDSLTRERDSLAAQLRACQEASRGGDTSALQARISSLEAEVARLNSRISDLEAEVARLNARNRELEAQLASSGGERPVLARYVIGNTVLFGSGKAELSSMGMSVLDRAASAIRDQYPTQNIVIEGHTDSAAISSSNWKSNWELGAGRALAVLHYLEDSANIPGSRLSATTYSFYRPVASNDTSDGKSQNRRTEIVVYAD